MSMYLEGAAVTRRHVTHNPGWYAVNEAVKRYNELMWAGDRLARLLLEENGNGTFNLLKTAQDYQGDTIIVKDASEGAVLEVIQAMLARGI